MPVLGTDVITNPPVQQLPVGNQTAYAIRHALSWEQGRGERTKAASLVSVGRERSPESRLRGGDREDRQPTKPGQPVEPALWSREPSPDQDPKNENPAGTARLPPYN